MLRHVRGRSEVHISLFAEHVDDRVSGKLRARRQVLLKLTQNITVFELILVEKFFSRTQCVPSRAGQPSYPKNRGRGDPKLCSRTLLKELFDFYGEQGYRPY